MGPTTATTPPLRALARARRTAPPRRFWGAALAAGWLVQAVLRAALGFQHAAPLLIPDESGYLLAARLLSGGAPSDLSWRTFYQGGYALLIAPAYWISDDAHTVYRLVVVVNALIGAGLVLLAYAAFRRIGLPRGTAYLLAHVTALVPSAVYYAQFALTDAVLPVIVLGWLLLLHAWLSGGGRPYGVAAGATIAFASSTHARGLVLLLVHACLLAFVVVRHRRTVGRGSWLPVSVTAGVAGAGWALNAWVRSQIYPSGVAPLGQWLTTRLSTLDGLAWTLSVAAGQLWHTVVATGGLAGAGLVALAALVLRRGGPSGGRPARIGSPGGPSTGHPAPFGSLGGPSGSPGGPSAGHPAPPSGSSGGPAADRMVAGTTLAAVAGIALATSAALPSEGTVANLAYGRYLACLTPVLLVAGLAVLARARRAAAARAALATGVLTLLAMAVVRLHAGDRLSRDFFGMFDFPEICFLTWNWDSLSLGQATVTAVLALTVAVLVTTLVRRTTALVLIAGVCVAAELAIAGVTVSKVTAPWGRILAFATDLTPAGLRAGDRVGMDYAGVHWRIWVSQAYQVPARLVPIDPDHPEWLPADVSLVVMPWPVGTDIRRTWPAAPPGWWPITGNRNHTGDWVAWRRALT
ncbi:ArnT family glycosyltransferase [Nonomuraea sp. NPDC003727]